jgi:Calcineurin-like phosphoesterase
MVKNVLSPPFARRRRGKKPFGLLAMLVFAPLLLRSAVGELGGPNAAAVSSSQADTPGTFTFAAAGDMGANSGLPSFNALDQSGVDFFLGLGDLDYDQTATDEAWCDYVKAHLPTLGPNLPIELVSGSHEYQGGANGYIMNHAACLPDRLGATGLYGAQYYFDYPASSPLMRVIMISPDLLIENYKYTYTAGSQEYKWVISSIDSARAAGIPWIAVGMHKVCITTGDKTCEIGTDLMNLLISKRVDLVLQGHDHNYQRSKQLALNGATCPAVPAGSYDPDCVVDGGYDNSYAKGAGPIFLISGSFGLCCYAVNSADPEAGYFTRIASTSKGFTKYTVGPGHISAQFVNSTGGFTDAFSIISYKDSDADGFTNGVESFAGTNPFLSCGVNAWPADFNNDGFSDGTDITLLSGWFGKAVPAAPPRYDIGARTPDGYIDGTDITRLAGLFSKTCY